MKVEQKTRTNDELEDFDYRDRLEILIDGKSVFEVWDGEPEDSNLSRDFNDCFSIVDLMKHSHQAGLDGEEFIVV